MENYLIKYRSILLVVAISAFFCGITFPVWFSFPTYIGEPFALIFGGIGGCALACFGLSYLDIQW
jgi:phosphotransferase system  glucose/maltose/N-acetylglucosamine-specific IIC component